MSAKNYSMNKLYLSLIAIVISISVPSAFADLQFNGAGIDLFCPTSTELDYQGIGTFLEMCPLSSDLSFTSDAPIITNIENLGINNVFFNFTIPVDQGLSNVTGFRIERATGLTFTTLFNNTNDIVNLWYQDLTANTGIFYKYRVGAWNDQGLSPYSNIASIVTSTIVPSTFCNGVTSAFELQSQSITSDSVTMCWDLFPTGVSIPSYMINYTSPWGTPETIIIADTGTNATRSYLVPNLQPNTQYSFMVKALGEGSLSNRLDIITLGSEFDIGSFTVNTDTNPDSLPFFFTKTLNNSTQTQLDIDFDNSLSNVTCDFRFQFAQTNSSYSDINENSAVQTDSLNRTTFVFNGVQNDVISVKCFEDDFEGVYVITQESFPFVEQIQNFRNGTYGTSGQFGAFDLITLFAILLSMIAFNRVNAGAGAVFTVIMIGALATVGIIQWPTIILSAVALVVLLAIITHNRDDVSE